MKTSKPEPIINHHNDTYKLVETDWCLCFLLGFDLWKIKKNKVSETCWQIMIVFTLQVPLRKGADRKTSPGFPLWWRFKLHLNWSQLWLALTRQHEAGLYFHFTFPWLENGSVFWCCCLTPNCHANLGSSWWELGPAPQILNTTHGGKHKPHSNNRTQMSPRQISNNIPFSRDSYFILTNLR